MLEQIGNGAATDSLELTHESGGGLNQVSGGSWGAALAADLFSGRGEVFVWIGFGRVGRQVSEFHAVGAFGHSSFDRFAVGNLEFVDGDGHHRR